MKFETNAKLLYYLKLKLRKKLNKSKFFIKKCKNYNLKDELIDNH